MAIITYQDLQRYMGKTFSPTEQTAATTIIGFLERELSKIIGRPLSPTQVHEEVHWLEFGQRQIFLRKAPVASVTSFYMGFSGNEVEVDLSNYDVKPWGIDNIWVAGTGYKALVTYVGGLSTVDASALERIIYSASVREMNQFLIDAQGLNTLTVEGTTYKMAEDGVGGFTKDERDYARSFKRYIVR
jgi:hypothetical protein